MARTRNELSEKAACSNRASAMRTESPEQQSQSTMPLARFQGKWTVKTGWPRLQTQPAPFKTLTRKSRLARGTMNCIAIRHSLRFFVVRYKAVIGHR